MESSETFLEDNLQQTCMLPLSIDDAIGPFADHCLEVSTQVCAMSVLPCTVHLLIGSKEGHEQKAESFIPVRTSSRHQICPMSFQCHLQLSF